MIAHLSRHMVSDLLAGIEWFDGISLGLGGQFESEFYSSLKRVKDSSLPTIPATGCVALNVLPQFCITAWMEI